MLWDVGRPWPTHSSTKRANRCSIASTKRRGSDWFKVGRQSGDLLMEPEEKDGKTEDRVRDMQRVKGGERARGRGWKERRRREIKRDKQSGVGRWGRSCSPEGSLLVSHSTGPSNV